MVQDFRDDLDRLSNIQAAFRRRFKEETGYDFSFEEPPAKRSDTNKIYYYDLLVIRRPDGTEAPMSAGIGKDDQLYLNTNALASLSNSKNLSKMLEDFPEILRVPEYNLMSARGKQVQGLLELRKNVLQIPDARLLGPGNKGYNIYDPMDAGLIGSSSTVTRFYHYMHSRYPEVKPDQYGAKDQRGDRFYIAEWKRFEERRLGAKAAILSELGHYEYRHLFEPKNFKYEIPLALEEVDKTIATYEKEFGEYDKNFRKELEYMGIAYTPYSTKTGMIDPEWEPPVMMGSPWWDFNKLTQTPRSLENQEVR
jgi:hypothetical protein